MFFSDEWKIFVQGWATGPALQSRFTLSPTADEGRHWFYGGHRHV
jgi:hypothetical protein